MADKTAFDPVLRRRVLLRGLAFLIGAAVLALMIHQALTGEFHADFAYDRDRGGRIQETIWLSGPVGIGCWALANGSVTGAFLLAALRPGSFRNPRVSTALVMAMVLGVGGLQLIRWLRFGT